MVHVVAEEYLHRMADHACFKINVLGTVLETGQVFCEQDDFRLGKPELEIDVSGERSSSWAVCLLTFECLRLKTLHQALQFSAVGIKLGQNSDSQSSERVGRYRTISETLL